MSLKLPTGAGRLYLVAVLLLVGCPKAQPDRAKPAPLRIGFFGDGVGPFIYRTDFFAMNAYLREGSDGRQRINLDFLRPNLEALAGLPHRVDINLGPVLGDFRPVEKVSREYKLADGTVRRKVFAALPNNKLRDLVSDEEIERRLQGFTELLKEHRQNVGALFLADEPYLNGTSKEELERAARKLRSLLSAASLDEVEFGIIEASGMFDAKAAEQLSFAMGGYTAGIDDYYERNKPLLTQDTPEALEFKKWVEIIKTNRLTTYDSAGNIFLGGGLPEGVTIIGFDFYVSTLLVDRIHDATLDYYSRATSVPACQTFRDSRAAGLRQKLSFFSDAEGAGTNELDHYTDSKLLDLAFGCRMEGTLQLLEATLKKTPEHPRKLLLVGESSANGLREFRKDGSVKPVVSPYVDQRVLDEVKRYMALYLAQPERFAAGLIYFIYPDTYDESIRLPILGAKSSPGALEFVYRTRNLERSPRSGNRPPVLGSIKYAFFMPSVLTTAEALTMFGEWRESKLELSAFDPDEGDQLKIEVTSSHPELMAARLSQRQRLELRYSPGAVGTAEIRVTVTDSTGLQASEVLPIVVR